MLTDKIALLTKIIMEKAEEKAWDEIVAAESEAEKLAAIELEKLKAWHRDALKQTMEKARKEEIRIIAKACDSKFRENLLKRQELVERVRQEFGNHLESIRAQKDRYCGIISGFIKRAASSLESRKINVFLDKNDEALIPEIQEKLKDQDLEMIFSLDEKGFGVRITDSDKRRSVTLARADLLSSKIIKRLTELFLKEKNESG